MKVAAAKERAPVSAPAENISLAVDAKVPASPTGLAETLGGSATLGKHAIAALVGKSDAQNPHFATLCLDANGKGVWDVGEQHALAVEAHAAQGGRPAGQSAAPIGRR